MSKHIIAFLFIITFFVGCRQNDSCEGTTKSPLPSLYITIHPAQLDSILNDRDYKAPADAIFVEANGDTLYDGPLKHIKTRGNSSWKRIKKPFSIKLYNSHKLPRLEKSKSFVLLANWSDESHIRNAIAFDISRAIDLPAPRYFYVSLYINNQYKGLYQMTNKVEINKHALDITDLEKLNKEKNSLPLKKYKKFRRKLRKGFLLDKSPDDITGGYLIEIVGFWSKYNRKNCGFKSSSGELIVIREPEHASKEEVEYIADYYNQMECALLDSTGYNPITGKHYSQYLDLVSFARSYLLNELLMNFDAGLTSFYMYKDCNDILFAGPSWDFDASLPGSSSWPGSHCCVNAIWAASKLGSLGRAHSGGIFYNLLKHEDFRQIVCREWKNSVSPTCNQLLENRVWDSLVDYLSYDAERDFNLINHRQSADYVLATRCPLDFLQERKKFLDWLLLTNGDDVISVADSIAVGKWANDRYMNLYYRVGEPIVYPKKVKGEDNGLIPAFYISGTDSIIPNGTVLDNPIHLEMRWKKPAKERSADATGQEEAQNQTINSSKEE